MNSLEEACKPHSHNNKGGSRKKKKKQKQVQKPKAKEQKQIVTKMKGKIRVRKFKGKENTTEYMLVERAPQGVQSLDDDDSNEVQSLCSRTEGPLQVGSPCMYL